VRDLLSDAGRLAWETDAVDAEHRKRIEARLREEGVRLHGVAPPRTTLEDLFLDALAKDAGGSAP
jgi:hypothetical protein